MRKAFARRKADATRSYEWADEIQRSLIRNRGSASMAIALVEWAKQYKWSDTATDITVSVEQKFGDRP